MDRYFELIGADGDFGQCYTEDVPWLVADKGKSYRGRNRCETTSTRCTLAWRARGRGNFLVAEAHAYLEGDCAADDPRADDDTLTTASPMTSTTSLISAMRCYGVGRPPPS